MNKFTTSLAIIATLASASMANAATRPAKIFFVENEYVYETVYVEKEVCTKQRVEYTTPSGDVLGGVIIGGILGKIIGGNDKGAAVGAILGGIQQGSQKKHNGYGYDVVCELISEPVKRKIQMFIVHWKYKGHRGHFYTEQVHYVGHTVYVDVNR